MNLNGYPNGQPALINSTTAIDVKSSVTQTTIGSTQTDASVATMTKTVLTGKDSAGHYHNYKVDHNGSLNVHIEDPVTGFGEVKVAVKTPVVQETFNYNINTRKFVTTVTGAATNGTATVVDNMAVVSTGTNTSQTINMRSVKRAKYRSGETVIAMFTAMFPNAVGGDNRAWIGIGDASDGFFLGMYSVGGVSSFAILRRSNATGSVVETVVTQANFNIDVMDGTGSLPVINTARLNLFTIEYTYLGAGNITFSMAQPTDGFFYKFHSISYPNQNIVPSIGNPILPICLECDNSGEANDVTIQSGSVAIFIGGENAQPGLILNSFEHTQTGVTALANVLTVRNNATYQGKTNFNILYPSDMSFAVTGGNKNSVVSLILNPSVAGTPAFTAIDANTSIAYTDIAGTTVTNGRVIISFALGKEDSGVFSISNVGLFLVPGDTLCVAVSTTGTATECLASIAWGEDI